MNKLRPIQILLVMILIAGCGNQLQFAPIGKNAHPGTQNGGGDTGLINGDDFVTESFDAPDVPLEAVDILFITDDSTSMQDDQANMATRFPNFISELQGVDWRIAITTTDASSSGLNGSLSGLYDSHGRETSNFILSAGGIDTQGYFERTIQRDTTGDGNERGIMVTNHAIKKRGSFEFAGFFRPQAALAVVILTDEDENSNANGRDPNGPFDPDLAPWSIDDEPDELVSLVAKEFPGKSFTFNAITIVPGDKNCFKQENIGSYGYVYAEIAQKTGGVQGSICDRNLTATVSSIGRNIKQQLTSFQLQETPDDTTLEVQLIPNDPQVTWKLSGDKIYFNKTLPKGMKVKVHYKKKTQKSR